ncbi:hypothetical protein ABT218_19870 [Streptomyces sp. NPDC001455]|uniref:hypothetical protein n=1 Tax=unclassified Streptomyces TaxID=2593676 RepID=UPI0033308CE4
MKTTFRGTMQPLDTTIPDPALAAEASTPFSTSKRPSPPPTPQPDCVTASPPERTSQGPPPAGP